MIEDAIGESPELMRAFLQKVLATFAEKNSGILAFSISKAPFSSPTSFGVVGEPGP